MTKKLFAALEVCHDYSPCSAAMNMAIDETLLEKASIPTLRLYRWDRPALSFGYFGRFAEVRSYESDRDLVRRWTGGGIVLHGDDLTYSIIIPRNDSAFSESPIWIYEKIHHALRDALLATGQSAVVTASANTNGGGNDKLCFAHPVRADVLLNGHKVAGAAQRRTRVGLLQQGSIQHVDLATDFETEFARALATKTIARELIDSIVERASQIAAQKYGTEMWLHKR